MNTHRPTWWDQFKYVVASSTLMILGVFLVCVSIVPNGTVHMSLATFAVFTIGALCYVGGLAMAMAP